MARPRGYPVYGLLAGAVLGLGVLTAGDLPTGVWHDDGVYVSIASSLTAGDGLRYSGLPSDWKAAKFPPAYPALVSATLRAAPRAAARSSPHALVNFGLLALGALAFAAWLRSVVALGRSSAALASFACFLPPALWSVANVALSESLFVATVAFALWTSSAWESKAGASRPASGPAAVAGRRDRASPLDERALLMGLVLFTTISALAFYTRTMGLVLPLAAAAALASRGRWRPAATSVVAASVWAAPWLAWSGRASQSLPEPLRELLGSYGGWWAAQIGADPGRYARHLVASMRTVGSDLVGFVFPAVSGPAWTWLAATVGLCAGLGLAALWRRSRTGAFTLIGLLVLLVLWPFHDARLLAPVAPLWLFVVGMGALRLARLTGRWGGGAVAAVVVAGSMVLNAGALLEGRHVAALEVRGRALEEAVSLVRAHVPEGAVVGAPEFWAALPLHAPVRGVPSARFLPLQTGAPSWGSPQQQYALWAAAGAQYLLLEQGGRIHGPALDELEARCPGAVGTVAVQPGLILARLGWDASCRSRVLD